MKKLLLATVALTVLAAPAMAADLSRPAPVYKAAPPPVYAYSWTGCYIGGNVGGLWARKEWNDRDIGVPLGTHDVSSWLGGVQAGCNYQFAGGWVIGIQGDYDWTDAKGSNASNFFFGETDQSRIKSLASVTGRVGYAWDRFLGYVKGGGAWERDDYTIFGVTGVALVTASETRGGWTVGVGGEYAFTNWLTGFAEYDFYGFGTRGNTFTGAFVTNIDIKETKSVFKVGLNWKFGGPFGGGPLVASY
jgi:outer membrane immunogenic protein